MTMLNLKNKCAEMPCRAGSTDKLGQHGKRDTLRSLKARRSQKKSGNQGVIQQLSRGWYVVAGFLLCTFSTIVYAVSRATEAEKHTAIPAPGVGDFASSLVAPVSILSRFVASASIAIGLSFMMASFVRFRQYRTNPMAYPLLNVLMLGFFALILMLLPLIYQLAGGGYSPEAFG